MSKDWARDGGHFYAEDIDGWKLATELDTVFAASNPELFMQKQYPNPPKDIIPENISWITRINMGLFAGAVAVGALLGGVEMYSQLANSLSHLH